MCQSVVCPGNSIRGELEVDSVDLVFDFRSQSQKFQLNIANEIYFI